MKKQLLLTLALAVVSTTSALAANKSILFANQPTGDNGNYVRVPNSSSLAINGPEVTIEAWVLFTGTNGQVFLGETESGSNTYLILNTSGSGAGNWQTSINESFVTVNAVPQVGGVWQHVALTYSAQARRFYVNGNLVSDTPGGGSVAATNDIFFSGRASSSQYLSGQLDDIRIWNRARTQAEIQANMNKTLTGSESGLIGYWTFDALDASGRVPDLSGHGNNGIIVGSAQLVDSSVPVGTVNTYTLTASAGANGTISPSGSVSVNQGVSQTFTITPSTGYHIADVLVDGSSVGAVSSYVFANITANHTISASFAANSTSSSGNKSIDFSVSAGSYVRVPLSSSLEINGTEITLEAWISFSGDNGQFFVGSDYALQNQSLTGPGAWQYSTKWVNSYQSTPPTGGTPVLGGVWQHVAFTGSSNGGRKFYLNGVKTTEYSSTGLIKAAMDFFMGGGSVVDGGPGQNEYLNGQLDEVRVWNRALSQAELQANMQKTLTGSESGLVGYWTFEALDAAGHVPDMSGHGNDGVIVGSPRLVGSTLSLTSAQVPVASVIEAVAAAGLSGATTTALGGEVVVLSIGLTGDGVSTLTSAGVTLSDLSSATGLVAGDFSQLRLYRNNSASLSGATQIGTQGTVNIGSATTVIPTSTETVAASQRFYLVTAVLSNSAVGGHAFKAGFATGGVSTSLGPRGTAVVASDVNKVTVASANNAPKATNDAITTLEDTPATVDVKANDTDVDGDALTVTAVTQGTKGAVAIKADGTLTYTPNADLNGSDSFTYTISDGRGGTATTTVAATITPVNDPPKAVGDAFTTLEDTPATVDVKANDTDVDGDALTVTATSQGAKGSVVLKPDGTVSYTPNADLNGSDSFTYTVSDGKGGTTTGTVAVTVTPVNDPPVVNVPGAQAVDAGKLLAFTVTASDPDFQTAQITAASLPPGATFNGSSFSWKPTNAQVGNYTVSFTASDGSLSDSKAMTIAVKIQIPEIAVGQAPPIQWYYYHGTWYPWVANGGRTEVRNGEPNGFTTLGAPIYFQNGYYNSVRGETRPAIGDLDGDGLGELVLGANTGSYGNLEIFSSDGAHKSWMTIPWSAYNSYNGETRPAMGDLDGSGKAWTVVGLGYGSSGYFYLGNTAGGSFFKYRLWLPLSWYDSYNGETRPAVGDLDGDGKAEIVVGLGIGGYGYLAVFGNLAEGCPLKQWLQIPSSAYNSANGETRPAIGDLDGDGKAEIVVGLGKEAGGYLAVFGSTPSGYAFKQWLYAPSGSAGWPAVGDLDGDSKAEVLYGASGYTSIGLFRGGSLSFVGWINTAQPNPIPAIGNIIP